MTKQLLLLLLVTFLSCGGDNTTNNTNEPSDLSIEVIQSEVELGLVTVQAQAKNTSEFHFYPNDGITNDPIINNSGEFTYTFSSFGTYTIEVRAYNQEGRFVKRTKQIAVKGNDPVNVGLGYSTPTSYEDMDLIWHDEFDGNQIDEDYWTFEIGDGCPNLCGWGNNELQYYRSQNTTVSDGVLTIEARQIRFQDRDYTSSRIITRDNFFFRYGRVDIRAKLPKGQGIWPALWMLGQNINSVGWPKCGEIDIMEMVGGNGKENTVHGNAFWDAGGVTDNSGHYTLSSGTFYNEFHVFSVIWDEQKIDYFVNDQLFHTNFITDPDKSEFHKPFFFIFNIAVGGIWPGNPDATTVFPTQMNVDYIRVF